MNCGTASDEWCVWYAWKACCGKECYGMWDIFGTEGLCRITLCVCECLCKVLVWRAVLASRGPANSMPAALACEIRSYILASRADRKLTPAPQVHMACGGKHRRTCA